MATDSHRAQKWAFPSGLILVHERTPSYPAVAYHLWVKVGSAFEAPTEAGVSHFLEHMLFKGTESRDSVALNDAIENFGGNINAFTTFDYTAYHMVLSSRFWKEGLSILLDMVFHSLLDEEDMEIERQVILEEIRESEDSLDSVFGDRFFHDLYPNHGYGRPIFGTMDGIRSFSHPLMTGFYKRWYKPGNIVLAVAGDVDWPQLIEAVNEFVPEVATKETFVASPFESTRPLEVPTVTTLSRGHEERMLELAFPIPSIRHADIPALDLLSIILGEGGMSRLYREIRLKRQLARDVGSSLFAPFQAGRFLLRALPYRETQKELLEELILQLRILINEGVSTRELNQAKLELDKELVFNDETVEGRARTLAYYESTFGSLEEELHYRDRVFAINERQMGEVARKYIDLRKMSLGLLIPASETAPQESELKEIISTATQRRLPGRALGRKTEEAERWQLPNGLKLVYRQVPDIRVSSIYAAAIGGLWAENATSNGISNLISATLDRGTINRSDERIAEEMTTLQGELSGVVGLNSLGLKMDLVGANLLPALELFADVLLNPEFAQEMIDQERMATLRDIEAQKDYFESTGINLFLASLFKGHPYGMNILGSRETIEKLTSETLWNHFRSVIRPERLVLGIVGGVDPGELKEEINAIFSEVRGEGEAIQIAPALAPLGGMQEIRRPIQGEKAYLYYGFRGALQTSADRYALDVVSALLASSGGGRLYVRLREELGMVYSVEANAVHGMDTGYIGVILNTAPAHVDVALEEVKNQLDLLTRETVMEEEIARVKNYLIGSYDLDLQRSASQAAQLSLGELFGTDRKLGDYIKGISNVTTEDIQLVARKYFLPNESIFVLLSPTVN